MEHVTPLPSKGHVSLWTDNVLKHFDPQDPHQMHTVSRALDHVMDMKQENRDRATGLKTAVIAAPAVSLQIEEDNLVVNKVKHIIHQTHPIA